MSVRQVQIVGLPGFQRELAQARRALPHELFAADAKAARLVAADARRRAPAGPHQGGGHVTPIRSSIQAGVGPRGGFVQIGGPSSPHAVPTEFGGTLRRSRSTARTQVRRQPYAYPAIAADREAVFDVYADAVVDTIAKAFPRGTLVKA